MLCGDCVVQPMLITSSSTRLYSFITFSRGTISWTANILRLCNYFWASLQIRIFFCIVWLLEDSDAKSIFRQEFWIFCICLKCQARDRVLDLVPDQYQKLNLKSFCPIPFSLMPSVLGKDSFEKKSCEFSQLWSWPPPKSCEMSIFFYSMTRKPLCAK